MRDPRSPTDSSKEACTHTSMIGSFLVHPPSGSLPSRLPGVWPIVRLARYRRRPRPPTHLAWPLSGPEERGHPLEHPVIAATLQAKPVAREERQTLVARHDLDHRPHVELIAAPFAGSRVVAGLRRAGRPPEDITGNSVLARRVAAVVVRARAPPRAGIHNVGCAAR